MECTALLDLIDWLRDLGLEDEPDACPDPMCPACTDQALRHDELVVGRAA